MEENTQTIPELEEMLAPLLLLEEGEHELTGDENIQELRKLFFPVTRECIYLNHASQGPVPRPVVQAVHDYLDDFSRFGSTHEERWVMYERGAHRRLASMIGARPEQIAFTASTGDGLLTIASGLTWQEGDEIVTAQGEFPTNVYPWLNLQEQGVQVKMVPVQNGRVVKEDIFAAITERTKLVSLSMVEFATGFRNDMAAIASYCHERGIWCGMDAMQALGVLDIDVGRLGVDFMAAASHKWLLSAKTTGILYLADTLLERLHTPRRNWFSVEDPFQFFTYDQSLKLGAARFEYASSNAMPIIAFDAALGMFEGIEGGMSAIERRVLGLTAYAISGLERLGYPVVSPQGTGERSSIVCFQPLAEQSTMTPQQIVAQLAKYSIYVAARGDVVRISPHFYNTLADIDALLNALEDSKSSSVEQR